RSSPPRLRWLSNSLSSWLASPWLAGYWAVPYLHPTKRAEGRGFAASCKAIRLRSDLASHCRRQHALGMYKRTHKPPNLSRHTKLLEELACDGGERGLNHGQLPLAPRGPLQAGCAHHPSTSAGVRVRERGILQGLWLRASGLPGLAR